jgi:outer membrane immunogenic protein
MKKSMVGAAAALLLTTSSAVADGISRRPATIAAPTPIYEPARTWSGFYFGAGIGAGAVVHDVSVQDVGVNVFSFDGVGGEGILGTVIVGWDWQVGPTTVFGLFVDYDFSNIDTSLSAGGGQFNASVDHNNSWSIGARFGWLSNPATLWYATAGYTEAQFDTSATLAALTLSGDDRFSGYFVGAGVDTRLWDNWFLRLEYRFSQFDSETFVSADGLTNVDVEPSMHTARLTLAYKFGGGAWNGWGLGR